MNFEIKLLTSLWLLAILQTRAQNSCLQRLDVINKQIATAWMQHDPTGLLSVYADNAVSMPEFYRLVSNGAEGQNLRIVKPIQISLPTPFTDSKMVVFKGVKGNDGHLNRPDPSPISANSQIVSLDTSEQLFKQHCATSHSIVNVITGPA